MKIGCAGIALVLCLSLLVKSQASSTVPCIDGLSVVRGTSTNAPPADLPRFESRTNLARSIVRLLSQKESLSPEHGPEDGSYFSLTAAQVTNLMTFCWARREAFPYIADAWDCDDIAREFHHQARIWGVRLTGGAPIAPAVGMAYVKLCGVYPLFPNHPDATGVYHVLNVILRNDGRWFFYEPQSGLMCPIEGPIYEGTIEVLKIVI